MSFAYGSNFKRRKLRHSDKTEIYRLLTEGAYRSHGNYVGPGWSAGKYQTSVKQSDVPPVDEFDATAKTHDIETANAITPEDLIKADYKFAKANILTSSPHRVRDGLLVGTQGVIRHAKRKLFHQWYSPDKRLRGMTSVDNLPRRVTMSRRFNRDAGDGMTDEEKKSAGTSDNVEPATNLMAARSGGADVKGHETGLSSFKSPTYGFTDARTVFHKFNTSGWALAGAEESARLVIRLNSLQDIIANIGTTEVGGAPSAAAGTKITGTSDVSTDTRMELGTTTTEPIGNQRPTYYDWYAALYQYYHVLGCKIKMHVINDTADAGASMKLGAIFTHRHGSNHPPNSVTFEAMRNWKDFSEPLLCYNSTSINPYPDEFLNIEYGTGEHYDIVDDASATIWTLSNATASHPEFLSIYFVPHPLSMAGNTGQAPTSVSFKFYLEITYLAQWKDLVNTWTYPTTITGYPEDGDN